MSFQTRMHDASDFEDQLMSRLNATPGWTAQPFGQRLLPDECRERLRRFEDGARRPSLIRWMPDIIAFRDYSSGRTYVALIDAKFSPDKNNCYTVEMSAIDALTIWTDKFYTPSFFVFSDWRVMTPRDVRLRGRPGPDPAPGKGSGTPYVLIPKRWSRPLEEYFPAAIALAVH